MFKTQIVSMCAKIVLSQNCRDVKNEVFEKNIAFLVLFFFAEGETEKWKKWKKGPKSLQK